MGLFDKKKNDLELHIVLNKGMIQDENRLIDLFNTYCDRFHYDHDVYKRSLAIELMTEALHNRFARSARINNAKMDLDRKEKEWIGKADICSYEDFFYISSSKDPMVSKLSCNKSVYLEGYVYETWNRRDIKTFWHHFFIVPYPCGSDYSNSDIEYLLENSSIEKIYINAPFSILHKLHKGDYVQISGEIININFRSEKIIGIDLKSIKIPDKPFVEITDSDPLFKIDWEVLEKAEKEKADAEWNHFIENFGKEDF